MSRPLIRSALLALTLGAIAARPASASFDPSIYESSAAWTLCTPGTLRACASVEVYTVASACGIALYGPLGCENPDDPTAELGYATKVVIRIRNLQGSFGLDNTDYSLIHGVRISTGKYMGYATGYTTGGGVSPDGSVGFGPSGAGSGGYGFEMGGNYLGWDGGGAQAIAGCDFAPYPANPYGYPSYTYQTCDPLGYTGALVTMELNMTRPFTAQDIVEVGFFNSLGPSCGVGYGEPCTVVPEPVTVLLLGTGLVGVGSVGILRRREKGELA